MDPGAFVDRLVAATPEVRPLLDEHLSDNFGDLLLHPFVARVRDLAIEAFESGNRDLSDRIVAVFDLGLREGDEQIQNAVSVSFVEDTPWWDEARQDFIASWPVALRDDADAWRQTAEARRRLQGQ